MKHAIVRAADWPGPNDSFGQEQTSRLEESAIDYRDSARSPQPILSKAVRRHRGAERQVGTAAAIW